jgi:hypothetical protein
MGCRSHCYNAMGLSEASGDCVNNALVRLKGGNLLVLAHLLAISHWTRNRVILREDQITNFIPEEQQLPGTPESVQAELINWLSAYGLGRDGFTNDQEAQSLDTRVYLVRSVGDPNPSMDTLTRSFRQAWRAVQALSATRVLHFRALGDSTLRPVDIAEPPTTSCSEDEKPEGSDTEPATEPSDSEEDIPPPPPLRPVSPPQAPAFSERAVRRRSAPEEMEIVE